MTSIFEYSNTQQTRIQKVQQRFQLFLNPAERLLSNRTVMGNGTVRVTSTSGSTLTSMNVLAALRNREDKSDAEQERRVQV